MNINKGNSGQVDLNELILRLKIEDSRYARISRVFQFIYWIFVPVYIVLTLLSYNETKDINELLGGICFTAAFLIFALYFRQFYKEYNYVDYSIPTLEMLKKAAYRYKPFRLNTIWLFIALLIMDVGLCFNTTLHFQTILVQVYFLGTLIIAVIIGLIIWKIKYKPLRDYALHLIKDIEANGLMSDPD